MHRTIPTVLLTVWKRSFRLYFIRLKDENVSSKDSASIDQSDAMSTTSQSTQTSQDGEEFPEEPTTCCMSGCANCVWLDYVEKVSEYFKDGGEAAKQEIEEKVSDPSMKAFLLSELRMRENMKK